jgi:hypothetical protein
MTFVFAHLLAVADRTGRVLVDKITPDGAPRRRPEIDRVALRRILLDSLPEGGESVTDFPEKSPPA